VFVEIVPNLVTTIIPVYNRSSLLREAVESVLSQTYPHFEVVIVNDGSTDDTLILAESLSRQFRDRIRVVSQSNAGPGAARERGRGLARGEYIQYLDSDDLLLETKFEIQVEGLKRHPNAVLAYGKTRAYRIGHKPDDKASRRTAEEFEFIFPRFLIERGWHSVTPLYRRAVCDEIGEWSNYRQEEDWEYDCRVGTLNRPLQYCDEYIADHRHHDGERLCHAWRTDAEALRDRVRAHISILHSAYAAGIRSDAPEMKNFIRRLFALARLCGRSDLRNESRRLLRLAEKGAVERLGEYRMYRLMANLVGWRRAAVFFESFPGNIGFFDLRRNARG